MDTSALENLWRAWIVTTALSATVLLCLSGIDYRLSLNATQVPADEFWLITAD
jgi:hypothetical protein